MFKNVNKTIRIWFSNKILDWADKLPKFQGGFVHQLQLIREHQKKWAKDEYQHRIKPNNASLTLKEIHIVVTIPFEEFHLVRKAIGKLFPNNEKVEDFIKKLKQDESRINFGNSSNIGVLSVKKDGYIYSNNTHFVKSLPYNISSVLVSYHRFMPSNSCLSFAFIVDDKFNNELIQKQCVQYLPFVIFKNLFKGFPYSYSMRSGHEGARSIILNHILNFIVSLDNWLEDKINIGDRSTLPKSIIEYYHLKGHPTSKEEQVKWFKDNRGWFNDYGILVSEYNSYKGTDSLYCASDYPNKKWPVHIITTFEDKKRENGFTINALSVMTAIFAILNTIQNSIEKYRGSGFQLFSKIDEKY